VKSKLTIVCRFEIQLFQTGSEAMLLETLVTGIRLFYFV